MANRDYKNVKRFVDNISAEVKNVMENGGGGEIIDVASYEDLPVPSADVALKFYRITMGANKYYFTVSNRRDPEILDWDMIYQEVSAVTFGNGHSIIVNFSDTSGAGGFSIGRYSEGRGNEIFINNTGYENTYAGSPRLIIEKNEANNQLIAFLQIDAPYPNYLLISNSVVIYEGDVSDIEDTYDIAAQLPTVEFAPLPGDTNHVTGYIAGYDIRNAE